MNQAEESVKESYCCPNPNCGKVFSRPKIIKYYVCPTCQTLLDIPSQTISDELSTIDEQDEEAKEQEPCSKLPPNQEASGEETLSSDNSIEKLQSDLQHDKIEKREPIDIASLEREVQLAVEGKVESESEYHCIYHFGYLGTRKEKGIPETCFACPKSVECMLFEINSSEETLQEIKKWYPPNST